MGLVALTFAVLVVAVVLWRRTPQHQELALLADYAASVVATMALLWLVGGYFIQAHELRLQRDELGLQRKAIELQSTEMREVSRQAALAQVHSIVAGFNSLVGQMRVNQVDSIHDIARALLPAMTTFRAIRRGATSQSRYAAFLQWGAVEGLCLHLFATIAACIKLYAPYMPLLVIDDNLRDEELVVRNSLALQRFPHVQVVAGPTLTVAQIFMQHRAEILRVRLAGCEASNDQVRGAIDGAQLETLRAEVDRLPAE